MKKMISFLLCAVLLLGLSTGVMADSTANVVGSNNTVMFVDISDHWAKSQIEYFAGEGIINGYEDGSFRPNGGVTREEFCKMLVMTFKAPLETPASPSFSDVPAGRWSYAYVEVCKDFLTGYANPFGGLPTFHPTEAACREDIAVALVRMMGYTAADAESEDYALWKFSDGKSISPNLVPYVSIACEKGLISGYPDGTFGPAKGITRAETVAMLNRAMKQAVTDINAELQLDAGVIYSSDGKTATINITAETGTTVTVNGEPVHMSGNYYDQYEGNYVHTFEQEGSADFVVEGKKAGKTKTVNVTAKYEVKAPKLVITNCPESATKESVTISGSATDERDNYPVVTVNGEKVYVNGNGNWSTTVDLTEGVNTFAIVATNNLGKSTTETRTVNFGVSAPKLVITNCPESATKESVTISGTVTDINDDYPVVTVNGEKVYVNGNGNWSTMVDLTEGVNTFTIVATNNLGKSTTETRTVNFGVSAPKLVITNCPESATKESVTISGTVTDINDDYPVVTVNGEKVYVNGSGNWSTTVDLAEGVNTFVIVATNKLGKSTTEIRTVTYGQAMLQQPVQTPVQQPEVPSDNKNTVEKDTAPAIHNPNWPFHTKSATVTVSGMVFDDYTPAGEIQFTINNIPVLVSADGNWSHTLTLQEGRNEIELVAWDNNRNRMTVSTSITYEK